MTAKVDKMEARHLYVTHGWSIKKIALFFGVSAQYISSTLKTMGVKVDPTPQRKTDVNVILSAHASGKTPIEIADDLALKPGSVYSILSKNGIDLKIEPDKPVSNNVTLTERNQMKCRNTHQHELENICRYITDLGFSCSGQILKDSQEPYILIPGKQLIVDYCQFNRRNEMVVAKNHHLNKLRWCEDNDLRLLTIFEDEWLSRRNQILSVLKAKLGKLTQRTQARKCVVKEVEATMAMNFLTAYHIQGSTIFSKALGLVLDNELLEIMTFGHHHRQNVNENTVVLSRLCTKAGWSVAGGASRLLSAFKTWIDGRKVVSWSDNRWSDGGVYKKLGFTLEDELPPDYSYINAKRERRSKQSFKKSSTGCPQDITERQWAMDHGWFRIWDCGKKRWILPSAQT